MSKYTTGEIAKLCGVSVRTVQYYDTRNILVPCELSEGGRRLYSEDDLKKMKIICFLREIGLPINSIGELFSEDNPDSVITILLNQQEETLREELIERETKLNKLVELQSELKNIEHFSVESIGDIAYVMTNKEQLHKLHWKFLAPLSIVVNILQIATLLLWIFHGIWWPFTLYLCGYAAFGVWVSKYYFKRVAYICPHCHEIFKPTIRQAFFARHTPRTRKLTCPHCDYTGHCVEIYHEGDYAL